MSILKISESVVICQNPKYFLVNSICVNLNSELLFIDTNIDLDTAKEFRKNMHDSFGVEKAVLTFTHSDYDHISGLEAFTDCQKIVSEEFIKRFSRKIAARKLNHLAFEPTKTFTDKYVFGNEDNTVTFTQTGGHSEDSCCGYIPGEKVLISGDNLLSDMPQYLLQPDVNLKKLVDCLFEWKTLDIEKIITGHGNVTNVEHMLKVFNYLESLLFFLEQAKKNNLSIEEVSTNEECPEYFEPDPKGWIPAGIEQAYRNVI